MQWRIYIVKFWMWNFYAEFVKKLPNYSLALLFETSTSLWEILDILLSCHRGS